MEITFMQFHENMPRREREKEKHRQEIIEAAITTFAQKGFPYATLDEVAKTAEFSKGAIYNYFDSKESLLFEIIQHILTFITILFQGSLSGHNSFKEELTDLFSSVTKVVYKNSDLYKLLTRHYAERFISLSKESSLVLLEIDDMNHEIIINRIKKAIKDGEIKEVNPEILVALIFGFFNSIINFIRNGCQLKDALLNCNIFVDYLFHGVENISYT